MNKQERDKMEMNKIKFTELNDPHEWKDNIKTCSTDEWIESLPSNSIIKKMSGCILYCLEIKEWFLFKEDQAHKKGK